MSPDDLVRPNRRQFGHESPLSPTFALRENDPVARVLLESIGPLKPEALKMASVVLANLVAKPVDCIFYSRDHNHYSRPFTRFYSPKYFTCANTPACHRRARPMWLD